MVSSEWRQLISHMAWADARVWSVVLPLPPAQADKQIRERLHHVHLVQRAYLQLWRGEPVDLPDAGTFGDLAAVHRWGRDGHAEIGKFMSTLDPREMERAIEYPWAQQLSERFARIEPTDLRQSVLQLALHTAHHRGQVNSRIRELGGEPPLADFIVWAWTGRPDAQWPADPD